MFREVPVLPVVVPPAGLLLVALLWRLRRRGRLTPARAVVALVLCVCAAGIVANTVFPIFLDKPPRVGPWTAALSFTPLAGYDVADAVTNVLVFVPLGVLVPLLAPTWSWRRVLGVAALLSLAIEVTQLVTANLLGGGHVADVNDLVFNVVGAAVGFGLLGCLSRVPGLAHVIRR